MKVSGIYLEQPKKQSNLTLEHKTTMPNSSNLKMKPQLQTDVVVFKGKEKALTQEQKALNNLCVLKQCLKINQKIGFGGREQAKKVIKQHVVASAFGGGFIKNPIGSAAALIANEAIMAVRIGNEYGVNSLSAKTLTTLASGSSGAMISKELVPKTTELNKNIYSALVDLIQKSVSDAFGASIAQVVPLVGRVVNAGVATATTFTFGEACMTMFENWVKDKPKDIYGCVSSSFYDNDYNVTAQEAKNLENKYDELVDKGVLHQNVYGANRIYWDADEYFRYVDDWAEACEQGLGHGYTPPPPSVIKYEDKSRDIYGHTKAYYESKEYWDYVNDWAEACEQGLGHGYTPPPPYCYR